MDTYPEPEFLPPHPHGYLYAGYRTGDRARLRTIERELAERQDVVSTALFRTAFRPPIPGSPRHDLLLLTRTTDPESAAEVRDRLTSDDLRPATVFTATNALRIGDTEASTTGTFLFNHFAGGDGDPVGAWRGLTGWYLAKTGVDNSTLLIPDAGTPFAVINYVRLPRGPLGFLVDQVRRPSFHTVVRRTLRRHGLHAMPVFYTRL